VPAVLISIVLCELMLAVHFDSINCQLGVLQVLNVKKILYIESIVQEQRNFDHI